MTLEIDYSNKSFKEIITNTKKGIKCIKINGDNIDIDKLCNILEDVKPNINIECKYKKEIDEEFNKRNTYQGFNRSILNMVKKIIKEQVSKNDYVVDMTIGNGYDTLYLAKYAKHVFGFDIQNKAISNTKKLLESNNLSNYTLFKKSHELVNTLLRNLSGNISLILFNLGYLPNGDKNITTMHGTTLNAVKNSLEILSNNGRILIVFYPHPEGKLEEKVVLEYLNKSNIKYKVYKNTINKESPYLIEICK